MEKEFEEKGKSNRGMMGERGREGGKERRRRKRKERNKGREEYEGGEEEKNRSGIGKEREMKSVRKKWK